MKSIGLLSVIITGLLLLYGTGDFPEWGDPNSPAATHLSNEYITKTFELTHVNNMVTAVLADFRGFDTMLETSVVFVAGIAIIAIMTSIGIAPKKEGQKDQEVSVEEEDLIIRHTCRLLVPPIQLFALYVIAHGHYSPGGGFQGGVILAASMILTALAFSLKTSLARVSAKANLLMGNLGVLIYAGTGLLCLLLGANFLDYHVLDVIYQSSPVMARYHSMLVVEIGVGFTVASVLFLIYANLASRGKMKRGL